MKLRGFVYNFLFDDVVTKNKKEDKNACEKCKLNGRRMVWGEGDLDAEVVIVGRNPGREENEVGRPFVGPAGRLLREVLGYVNGKYYITNVVKCYTDNDEEPDHLMVKCCSGYLEEELSKLSNRKIIIALGDMASKWFVGTQNESFSITKERGLIKKTKYGEVMTTFHPSYVRRSLNQKDKMGVVPLEYFVRDIKNAFDFAYQGRKRDDIKITIVKDESDVFLMERILGEYNGLVGFDFETTSLDVFGDARVLSVALSAGNKEAFVVPLSCMDGTVKEKVVSVLGSLYRSKKLVMYNSSFDMKVACKCFGWDPCIVDDGLLLVYLKMGEISGLSLKRLAVDCLGKIDYSVDWKEIGEDNVGELLEYNAKDAVYAVEVMDYFKSRIDDGMRNVYEKVLKPANRLLVEISVNGLKVDKEYLLSIEKEVSAELEKMKREFGFADVNLNSPKQVLAKLKSRGLSIDSTRQKELEKYRNKYKVVDDLLNYREMQTVYSRYIVPYIRDHEKSDGLVHPEFSLVNTATGRTACTNPNVQNIPVRMGDYLRRMFISRWEDGLMLKCDYSQQELRVAAMISGDENMIKMFKNGNDIHYMAALMMGLVKEGEEDKEKWEKARRIAKALNFGVIYGRGAESIAGEFKISVEEGEHIRKKYFNMFPGLWEWIERQKRFLDENGYVRSMFGRVRWLKEVWSHDLREREEAYRKAVNTPIQADASDIALLGMCRVVEEIKKRELRTKIVNFEHDAGLFDVYPGELDEVISIIKREAVKVEVPSPVYVPLEVEVSYGKSWGDCK
uniref:DNA polymerase I n=1 Tax=candidate division CPR3 bacterium TaxID=2268181 RepID=A0A7V3J973_UNCC3